MSHHMAASSDGRECLISMVFNTHTKGACFLSSDWYIENDAMFAATCVGVVLLVVLVELARRMGKEYDEFLLRQFRRHVATLSTGSGPTGGRNVTFRASPLQQGVRALIHAITFAGAYIVMLLAMYFNVYVLVSIFLGAGLGKYLCDWMVVRMEVGEKTEGGEEAKGIEATTVCCG